MLMEDKHSEKWQVFKNYLNLKLTLEKKLYHLHFAFENKKNKKNKKTKKQRKSQNKSDKKKCHYEEIFF